MMLEGDGSAGGETSSTGTTDQTASSGEGSGSSIASSAEGDGGDAAVVAYTPNTKFKYVTPDGDDAEGDIEDFYHPLMKDAESEKKVRELYARGHGIDFVKNNHQTLKQEHAQVRQELSELKSGYDTLRSHYRNGDLDSMFEAMQIPEQVVMQYALQKAQYAKMTPDQRSQYDAYLNQKRQLAALQGENQSLKSQSMQLSVTARTRELDMTLARPEVATMASAFDQRMGRRGAFRDEVIRRAQLHFHNTKQDVSAEAVIAEMNAHYTPFLTPATTPAGGAGQTTVTTPGAKPVIPNINGRGTSPAKKVPRSIEDLKKIGRDMASRGAAS